MCQWGAFEYSKRGWTYLQILDHYYNLDWYYDYGGGSLVEEVPPPTPEPVPEVPQYNTLLYLIITAIWNLLGSIRNKLGDIADSAVRIPLVGSSISYAFNMLSSYVEDVWLRVHDFREASHDIHRFIQDILTGELFRTLLLAKVPGVGALLADPVGWVRNQVNELIASIRGLLDNPTLWILERIYDWFPWFRSFIDNPAGFIIEQVRLIRPAMLDLLSDPLGYVLRIINAIFPRAMDFFIDPEGWLKERLQRWLNASGGLWTHTWSYVFYKIREMLDNAATYYSPWFRSYGAKLLRYLFEGVWRE